MANDDKQRKQQEAEEEKNRQELARRLGSETPPPWKNAAYMFGTLLLGFVLNLLVMIMLEGGR